jgi:hypothetical protein
MKYCCMMMRDKCEETCPIHPINCPDTVMVVMGDGRHVIPIHDGGDSGIVINFCPWCGADLNPRVPFWVKWLEKVFR